MSSAKPSFTAQSPNLRSFHEALEAAFEDGDPNVNAKTAERGLISTIRQVYDALGKGDDDAMMNLFTDDIEIDIYAAGVRVPSSCQRHRGDAGSDPE